MFRTSATLKLSFRKSQPLKQGGVGGMDSVFRGIPGGDRVERAMKRRSEEDTRESEGTSGMRNVQRASSSPPRSETNHHSTSLAIDHRGAGSSVSIDNTADPFASFGQELVSPRGYMRRVTGDFYEFAKRRPLPQVPWLQDTRKSYLDDAERIFGRKEGWHLNPDPNVRRQLLMILKSFITDTARQSNELRGTIRIRKAKVQRLSAEYAHYMLIAAFDDHPVERIRKEWRVPKTAEDLLREEEASENAPMLEILKLAEEAKKKRLESEMGQSVSAEVGGSSDDRSHWGSEDNAEASSDFDENLLKATEVRERLEGSAAISNVSLVNPFAESGGKLYRNTKGTPEVDMRKEGLMHLRLGQSSESDIKSELAAARKAEQQLQFPFLRSRVTDDNSSIDSSLVDWTQSFFPEDTVESRQVPKGLNERQMELAAADRAKELTGSASVDSFSGRAAKGSEAVRSILDRLTGGSAAAKKESNEGNYFTTTPAEDQHSSRNPKAAAAQDDIDEEDMHRLRSSRATERLESDTLLRTGVANDDPGANESERRYETELYKLQSQSKQQLTELRAKNRIEKAKINRNKQRNLGRHSLSKSLESFVKSKVRGFDGEGFQYDGKGRRDAASSRHESVDHQGIPLARRPQGYQVRSKGKLLQALGVSEGGIDSDHFSRFSARGRGSNDSLDEGSFVASTEEAKPRGYGRRNDKIDSPRGAAKVDWSTTILSRQSRAGAAGPKWHRANERLIRIARGEDV